MSIQLPGISQLQRGTLHFGFTVPYMYIAVGSTNQVKIHAVMAGVEHMWPTAQVEGFETSSGVSEQPMTDEETKIGSMNRAIQALNILEQVHGGTLFGHDEIFLGVGLEGGVDLTPDGLMNVVWCSVVDQKENMYSTSGARFVLPKIIADRISAGEEMGPVMDHLVKDANVKKKQGMIGVVTDGFFNRTDEYASIARLTIGLWYGRTWEEKVGR
ncbi:inosine/xanthosine triphosphatase [Candidatus Cerribacteria bacterium 'Amazon FNV 2010 28 9']|uniref:inosine/xanthosine triphosphatase n=1 Tax=Candidatus Cerribacteria bacterium 'Amazon FNV 2010 28 9' TaxID=2081795 RepID=A0A317JPA7_9BACT|nr:MAG: inosine/xanthosine triphosphatase [Candidatus Cerribacteria bacterium 'Amazon FNV 2010 28 9']